MATTIPIVVETVRRRLLEQGKQLSDTIDADIEAAIPAALQIVGLAVAASPDQRYRGYAQSDITFAMVAGVIDLSTQPALLINHVLRVTHPVHGVMSHAKDVTYLAAEKAPMGGSWYAIEADKLFGMLDDGVSVPDDDAGVVIRGNSIPTLANLHAQLVDDLVLALFGLASSGGGGGEAA